MAALLLIVFIAYSVITSTYECAESREFARKFYEAEKGK